MKSPKCEDQRQWTKQKLVSATSASSITILIPLHLQKKHDFLHITWTILDTGQTTYKIREQFRLEVISPSFPLRAGLSSKSNQIACNLALSSLQNLQEWRFLNFFGLLLLCLAILTVNLFSFYPIKVSLFAAYGHSLLSFSCSLWKKMSSSTFLITPHPVKHRDNVLS